MRTLWGFTGYLSLKVWRRFACINLSLILKKSIDILLLVSYSKWIEWIVLRWNRWTVRQSSEAPGGNPDLLFHLLPLAFQRKGIQIGQEDINIVKEILGLDYWPVAKNDEMRNLLKCYFQIHNLRMPTNWESALDLYVDLWKLLKEDGFLVWDRKTFTFLRRIKIVDSIITQYFSSLVFSLGVNFMENM